MQKGAGIISLSLHLYPFFLLNIAMLSLHFLKKTTSLYEVSFWHCVFFFPNNFVRVSVSLGFTVIKNDLQFVLSTFTNTP